MDNNIPEVICNLISVCPCLFLVKCLASISGKMHNLNKFSYFDAFISKNDLFGRIVSIWVSFGVHTKK